MTCEELAQLLPDLMDDTLTPEVKAEAEIALARCPACQKELEAARQIRNLLTKLQAGNVQMRPSAAFEARLFARIRQQKHGLALLDLSSRGFGLWLVEFINLVGHLVNVGAAAKSGTSQP